MTDSQKCIDWKDILIRASKTFIQAFIAALSINGVLTIDSFDALKNAAIGALVATGSAVVSAVMNITTCLIKDYKKKQSKNNVEKINNDKN